MLVSRASTVLDVAVCLVLAVVCPICRCLVSRGWCELLWSVFCEILSSILVFWGAGDIRFLVLVAPCPVAYNPSSFDMYTLFQSPSPIHGCPLILGPASEINAFWDQLSDEEKGSLQQHHKGIIKQRSHDSTTFTPVYCQIHL